MMTDGDACVIDYDFGGCDNDELCHDCGGDDDDHWFWWMMMMMMGVCDIGD